MLLFGVRDDACVLAVGVLYVISGVLCVISGVLMRAGETWGHGCTRWRKETRASEDLIILVLC